MFTTLDNHVTQLHRLGTEGMQLDDYNLDEGQFCSVTRDEINQAIFSWKTSDIFLEYSLCKIDYVPYCYDEKNSNKDLHDTLFWNLGDAHSCSDISRNDDYKW